jgi:hypothetical protein
MNIKEILVAWDRKRKSKKDKKRLRTKKNKRVSKQD